MPHSTASDRVNQLLRALGDEGGPAVVLNDQDLCSLTVDERLECNLEVDGESLIIFAPLLRLPTGGLTDFLSNALRANLFGLDTAGGHLGLCDQSGFLVYSRTLELERLDEALFLDIFEDFVQVALELEDDFSRAPTSHIDPNPTAVNTAALRV
ncbi:MAG: type III secretion system chaperone [Pseudomonadota bacterium]